MTHAEAVYAILFHDAHAGAKAFRCLRGADSTPGKAKLLRGVIRALASDQLLRGATPKVLLSQVDRAVAQFHADEEAAPYTLIELEAAAEQAVVLAPPEWAKAIVRHAVEWALPTPPELAPYAATVGETVYVGAASSHVLATVLDLDSTSALVRYGDGFVGRHPLTALSRMGGA